MPANVRVLHVEWGEPVGEHNFRRVKHSLLPKQILRVTYDGHNHPQDWDVIRQELTQYLEGAYGYKVTTVQFALYW